MELNEKEQYIAPAMLVVEVNVGRAVCNLSDQDGQGHGFTGWE